MIGFCNRKYVFGLGGGRRCLESIWAALQSDVKLMESSASCALRPFSSPEPPAGQQKPEGVPIRKFAREASAY